MGSKFGTSGEQWFQTKKFERFWNVYNKCMMYTHQDTLSRCQETKNDMAATLYRMVKAPLPQMYSDFCEKNRRVKIQRKKRKSNKNKRPREKIAKSTENQNVFILTDDDTLQVKLQEQMKIEESSEIDDEFLTFMKTSLTHRIKWQHLKEQKKETSESEVFLDIEKREHPDITREKDMNYLYGDLAAQIHGMETALQLSFDRISTLHQPSIWPNIPIKLRYD